MHDHLQQAMSAARGGSPWPWLALILLGAYHGLNPAMGWLFAVALGMHARSGRRVVWALLPIGLGHAASVGLVLALLWGAQAVLPARPVRYGVAALLVGYGLFHLVRSRHAGGRVGMQVGFRDLALWSFLMATAHGAGLMLAPLLWWQGDGVTIVAHGERVAVSAREGAASLAGAVSGVHAAGLAAPASSTSAPGIFNLALTTALHASSMLLVAGAVAWLVYHRLGLLFLRRAWVNLDLVWALALVASGMAVALTG